MNKESFRGTKSVFGFTIIQYIKSKTFIISTAILVALALISFPVMSLISGIGEKNTNLKELGFDEIFVHGIDENWIDGIEKTWSTDDLLKNIKITPCNKDSDEIRKELNNSGSDVKYIYMSMEGEVPAFTVIYGKETAVKKEDVTYLSDFLMNNSTEISAYAYGATEENIGAITTQVMGDVLVLDQLGNIVEKDEDEAFTEYEYGITYGFSIVLMLFIVFASEAVAMSIITEKSSKVVEYLMVSIKPMALICGKICAMLCSVAIEISAIAAAAGLSSVINGFIFRTEDGMFAVPAFINTIIKSGIFEGANFINVTLGILAIVSGLLIYGFLAGITGATVSKIEEAAEGMKIFTFAVLIGLYLTYGYVSTRSAGGNWGSLEMLPFLLPLSAPFIVPEFLLMGEINISTALISLGISLIVLVLLMVFVSKVYEYLIYYKGQPMKLKQLISIAKTAKK